MSWQALAERGLVVRPFAGVKPTPGNQWSRFKASIQKTLRLLSRELDMLDAGSVIIELDIRERDLRLDGYPRADARIDHPAVAVSFESPYGPLRYATCEFTHWDDNLRAIALALEALRAVDRYGVSKRGEQYQGYKALTTGGETHGIDTRPQALEVIMKYAAATEPIDEQSAIRQAIRATHPDTGGNRDDFERVMRAKTILETARSLTIPLR